MDPAPPSATHEILWFTLLVTLAELVTSNWLGPLRFPDPVVATATGVVMHSVIMFVALLRGTMMTQRGHRELGIFLTFFSLAPLIRIVSVAVPLVFAAQAGFYTWLWIISVPLYFALFALVRADRDVTAEDLRIAHHALRGLPLGIVAIVASIGFGLLEYLILRPAAIEPRVPGYGGTLFAVGGLFVATGLFEEMLFRGVLQRRLGRLLSPGRTVVLVSLVFAVLHIGNQSWADLGLVFVIGLTYGGIAQRTGTIVWVSIGHTVANVMLFMVSPVLLAG